MLYILSHQRNLIRSIVNSMRDKTIFEFQLSFASVKLYVQVEYRKLLIEDIFITYENDSN